MRSHICEPTKIQRGFPMTDGIRSAIVQYLPQQSPPVLRSVLISPISAEVGVEACDNDHNTDTENDRFFVKMA
jgi:hypothetical protein